jgi:hypothetical protein
MTTLSVGDRDDVSTGDGALDSIGLQVHDHCCCDWRLRFRCFDYQLHKRVGYHARQAIVIQKHVVQICRVSERCQEPVN